MSQNANTNTGYVVIKYASNGNAAWVARYDSANYPLATPTGFAVDSTGSVVVTGSVVTVKYDGNGNPLWTAGYNAQAIAVDGDQNVYLTGVSSNFTTMKLSPASSNLWTETWAYQGLPNLSQVIAIDASSNVYVAGRESWQLDRDVFVHIGILKYDANGNQLWEKNTAQGGDDYEVRVHNIYLDNAANVYLAADYSGEGGGSYQSYKYDTTGNLTWSSNNLTGYAASVGESSTLDNAENFVLTGEDAHNYPNYCYGTYKLNSNGNSLWGKLYCIQRLLQVTARPRQLLRIKVITFT